MKQRIHIRIPRSRSDKHLVRRQNVVFAPLRLRFVRVQPPRIHALLKQRRVRIRPILFARRGIGRVIERLPRWMKTRLDHLRNEPPILVELFVGRAPRPEVRPNRNHQMKMLLVQRVDHSPGVRVILVPRHLPHRHPPEPVLHNVVHRYMQSPVSRRHRLQFLLRLVFVLALPEPISPPAKQRNLAGQFAIVPDNLIRLRPVNKVVVHPVRNLRAQIKRMNKPVVHHAPRRIVPEDPIPIR